ncbi:ABC transporter ATP-binding protein/permease, partial [bacterium]|nr:ABC transporter ATP-binding protein/permease [bacterium]
LIPYTKGNRRLLILPAVLIPLIAGLQIAGPLVMKRAIDDGVVAKDLDSLVTSTLMFFGIIVASYFARTAQALASIIFVQRMIIRIRVDLVRHVLKLKAKYHDKNLSGALVTRATSDFDNLSESLNFGVLNTLVDLATLSGSIIAMFMLNWKLALVACFTLPIVVKAINWFSTTLKHSNLITRKKIATLNAYTQESLYGNSTIKLLRAEEKASEKHANLNESYRNSQMKIVTLDALLFSVIDGISSITIGLVLWASLSDYFPANALTAGVMVAFVQLLQQLFDPLKQLGSTMAMLQGVFTAIDRIFGILEHKEFIDGKNDSLLTGAIKFKKTGFSYDQDANSKVLKDISFEVGAGESVAIVGSTGSGKSTVIKLLSKLYDGYSGSITFGDKELRDYSPEGVRSSISIVPQDIVLFDGTISFNIGLGLDGVSENDIKNAAKVVGADKFIDALPGGYEHQILERGANLSHGQRQLIAFARALCKNPEFVILDEATSSVDPASERQIQEALLKILHDKTVIVIAHRLSTIKECDKIIVLEKGDIVETGTHDDLISNKNRYFELVNEFAGGETVS